MSLKQFNIFIEKISLNNYCFKLVIMLKIYYIMRIKKEEIALLVVDFIT